MTKKEKIEYIKEDVKDFEEFLIKTARYWETVKMMELDNPDNMDATFIKELVNCIEVTAIPIEVLARHKEVNPGYVLEKLKHARRYIDATIRYFEKKQQEEK